jgi:hypothetical protein
MSALETNIFPITNLAQLSATYRLYRVRGLRSEQPEYFQNRQALLRALSYEMHSPVTVIDRDALPHVAIREDAPEPRSPATTQTPREGPWRPPGAPGKVGRVSGGHLTIPESL